MGNSLSPFTFESFQQMPHDGKNTSHSVAIPLTMSIRATNPGRQVTIENRYDKTVSAVDDMERPAAVSLPSHALDLLSSRKPPVRMRFRIKFLNSNMSGNTCGRREHGWPATASSRGGHDRSGHVDQGVPIALYGNTVLLRRLKCPASVDGKNRISY